MKLRDFIFLVIGMIIGLIWSVFWFRWKEIYKLLKDLAVISWLKRPHWYSRPRFRRFEGKKPPPNSGTRIWPPKHPGGASTNEKYDWAYEYLIVQCGYGYRKAWEVFRQIYPEEDSVDPDLSSSCKNKFISAMKYRRKQEKG